MKDIELLKEKIKNYFKNKKGLLRQNFSNGKCLLINDPEELSRFKMVMFSRIVDFAYYRDKMQSGLIKKVVKGIY